VSTAKHIGFTGTRYGMTDEQRKAVDSVLADIIGGDLKLGVIAHHGDCVGADAHFHDIAVQYGAYVVGHIPIDGSHRAFCHFNQWLPALPHMKRNREIVAAADVMIATPAEAVEQPRGGTWATIRMARKAKKPLAIVRPDGHVVYERWGEV
jgi:hypothetical protein